MIDEYQLRNVLVRVREEIEGAGTGKRERGGNGG